jgi:2-C-methyl-D-erythritol 2,4-cyclodiphosphate synthase
MGAAVPNLRIGQGIDLHRFCDGSSVTLGGVEIPFHKALEGHSDADVLLHAIMDALLGAAGLQDIGHHFPNTDMSLRGISSLALLEKVRLEIFKQGWLVVNIDATVVAEAPKVNPHVAKMKALIAQTLGIGADQVGIKATTAETLGSIGRGEGIFASAVALIYK